MGYYIDTEQSHGKASFIAQTLNGVIVDQATAFDAVNAGEGVIVVVNNGLFEAAGFAYDVKEFEAFTEPNDTRSKEFVILDREVAKQASRYRGV